MHIDAVTPSAMPCAWQQPALPFPPALHVVPYRGLYAPDEESGDLTWSRWWQMQLPGRYSEVVIGGLVVDILTPTGVMVELIDKHRLTAAAMRQRETALTQYGDLVCVFNVIDEYRRGQFSWQTDQGFVEYRWPRQRQEVAACTVPVYFDTGDDLILRQPAKHYWATGGGLWRRRSEFADWLNGRDLAEAA